MPATSKSPTASQRERQLDWLDEAYAQAMVALRLMAASLKALVMCGRRPRAIGLPALGACARSALEIYSYHAVWAAVSVSTDIDALAPCVHWI